MERCIRTSHVCSLNKSFSNCYRRRLAVLLHGTGGNCFSVYGVFTSCFICKIYTNIFVVKFQLILLIFSVLFCCVVLYFCLVVVASSFLFTCFVDFLF